MNTDQRRAALITKAAGRDGGYLSDVPLVHGWPIRRHEVQAQDVLGVEPANNLDQMIVTTLQFDMTEEIAA